MLSAKKLYDVTAPAGAVANSVDWLFLGDDDTGVSQGLKAVYRVETAGGKASGSACTKKGQAVQVEYAAEYW